MQCLIPGSSGLCPSDHRTKKRAPLSGCFVHTLRNELKTYAKLKRISPMRICGGGRKKGYLCQPATDVCGMNFVQLTMNKILPLLTASLLGGLCLSASAQSDQTTTTDPLLSTSRAIDIYRSVLGNVSTLYVDTFDMEKVTCLLYTSPSPRDRG